MSKSRISINLDPSKRSIFNPLLDGVVVAKSIDSDMVATARVINEQVGVCPKCAQPMTTATIANDDTVYYCLADRVSTPMPDRE